MSHDVDDAAAYDELCDCVNAILPRISVAQKQALSVPFDKDTLADEKNGLFAHDPVLIARVARAVSEIGLLLISKLSLANKGGKDNYSIFIGPNYIYIGNVRESLVDFIQCVANWANTTTALTQAIWDAYCQAWTDGAVTDHRLQIDKPGATTFRVSFAPEKPYHRPLLLSIFEVWNEFARRRPDVKFTSSLDPVVRAALGSWPVIQPEFRNEFVEMCEFMLDREGDNDLNLEIKMLGSRAAAVISRQTGTAAGPQTSRFLCSVDAGGNIIGQSFEPVC